MDSAKAKLPAASRPSDLNTFMAYLSRSLKTKTVEAPSTINRIVRSLYPLIIAVSKDYPGCLEELITRIDFLERGKTTAWYKAQARHTILAFRHELVKREGQRQFPPPPPRPAVYTEREANAAPQPIPAGQVIGSLFPELVP